MKNLIVLGIIGRARSGKDTAANALGLHRGCHRVALADGVRSAFADLSGPTSELHKELRDSHNFRRALQTLGTEAREEINAPGLWVHLLLTKIYYAHAIHPVARSRFVIPDMRFRHEESMVRYQVNRWGGKFASIKLERGGDRIDESSHVSETEVDSIPTDFRYINDATIEELSNAVVYFFDRTA